MMATAGKAENEWALNLCITKADQWPLRAAGGGCGTKTMLALRLASIECCTRL